MNQLKAIERRKKQKICIYKNKRKKIKKDITFWQRHRYWSKNRIICINWHLRIFVSSTHRRLVPHCTKWLCSCKGPTHSIHFKPGNIKGSQKFAQFIVYFLNNKKNYTANLVDLFQNWNFSVSSSWSLQLQYFNIRIFLFIYNCQISYFNNRFFCLSNFRSRHNTQSISWWKQQAVNIVLSKVTKSIQMAGGTSGRGGISLLLDLNHLHKLCKRG